MSLNGQPGVITDMLYYNDALTGIFLQVQNNFRYFLTSPDKCLTF